MCRVSAHKNTGLNEIISPTTAAYLSLLTQRNIAQIKKKGGEISPAQFADAKLSVVLCYLPLGFVAQGLLQFLQVLRNLQWFIMSYDHLQLLIPKVQHPHSVSCHKIIFISNSKETTSSPSLAFLSSSSPLLPTSQTRRESEHSWLSHF